MNQQRLIYLLVAGLISLTIPATIYLKVRFPQPLTAAESSVMNISPAGPSYAPKVWQPAAVQLPITAQKISPPASKPGAVPVAPVQKKRPPIAISVTDSND